MKITKFFLISVLVIVILGAAAVAVFKSGFLQAPAEELTFAVSLTPEQQASLAERRQADFDRLEIFPNTYEVYLDLGNISYQLGQASQAIKYYTRAWEILPGNSTPWINIGNVYLVLKQYNQAEAAFLKAKELNPAYPLNYINLADLYKNYFPEKQEQIRGIYLDGLAAVDNDLELLVPFATYLYEAGNYAEALLYFQELQKNSPDGFAYQDMIDLINEKING